MDKIATRSEMKAEAVKRLTGLKVLPSIIGDFKNGKIAYSERQSSRFDGVLYWVDDMTQYTIDKLEDKYDIVVYHAQLTHMDFGDMMSFLFVDNKKSYYARDRKELLTTGRTYAYVLGVDGGEFGDIIVAPKNGGITRTA